MTEHRVVILGDAWIEEIRDPGGMRESVGGDAVELACALIGDGLALTVVVPLGDDPDGERIRTVLEDRGVRVVAAPRSKARIAVLSCAIAAGPSSSDAAGRAGSRTHGGPLRRRRTPT
ncbi:hypothetical protein [Microbacterium xylanilyticum]